MYKKLWQNFAMATLLASGLAVIWGFLAIWGVSTYESSKFREFSYEDLAVDAHGNAWIKVHNYYPSLATRNPLKTRKQLPYRTLEGKPIETPTHDFWLSDYSMTDSTSISWAANSLQNDWRRRVQQVASNEREVWWLVHNGAAGVLGRAYLVGYDLLTRLPVGYCSRQGFRTELPIEEQCFRIDGQTVGHSAAVISSRKTPRIALATLNGWFVFTVKQRQFRVIDDTQPYLSVGTCEVPESIPHAARENLSDDEKAALATFKASTENFSLHWPEVFAARLQDRIVMQHPQQKQPFEFLIPKEYQSKSISFYFVAADHAMLAISKGRGVDRESLLLTTNAAGEIQKSQPIAWARRPQTSNRLASFSGALAMPSLLVLSVVFFGIAPSQPNFQQAGWLEAGYLERLSIVMSEAWPAMLALVIFSVILTWQALRWHRKHPRPNAGAWAAFVFLLGLPGFVAYWAYLKRPPIETCPECSEQVPRNRDACARCETPFAPPPLLGTEILA